MQILYEYEPCEIFEALGFDYGLEQDLGEYTYRFRPWGGRNPAYADLGILENEWEFRLGQSIELQADCVKYNVNVPPLRAISRSIDTMAEKRIALNMIRYENHIMGCETSKAFGADPNTFHQMSYPLSPRIVNVENRYGGDQWVLDGTSTKWKALNDLGEGLPLHEIENELQYRSIESYELRIQIRALRGKVPFARSTLLMAQRQILGEGVIPLWIILDNLRVEVNCMLLRRSRYALSMICKRFLQDIGYTYDLTLCTNVLNYEFYLSDEEISDNE